MAENQIKLNNGQGSGSAPGNAGASASPKVNEENEVLDAEYTDKREVTISQVKQYSAYRKINFKTLGTKTEVIGSSVNSCRVLSSHRGEVEAYFPQIIGLSPNNPEFISRVKAYLSNIQFVVSENGAVLDTTFIYHKKRDFLAVQAKEDAINKEYEAVDKTNVPELKKALKKKIDALDALESTKYALGYPLNVEQYLMYRHCLLYSEVAKEMSLINEDITLRFYIKDEAKEAARQKKIVEEKKKAMKNFVELCGTGKQFDAVFIQVCLATNRILSEEVIKPQNEKENILMSFVNENPDKFNKYYSDKNIITRGFIETLIMRGELIRSEYNQQISTTDGTFIGANMKEAIAYFNNPNNASIKTAYETKINAI